MEIIVDQVDSLFDRPISIKILKCNPRQNITLFTNVAHSTGRFQSRAMFTADDNGVVDLATACTKGGSLYEGVDPMGVIWSLSAAPSERLGNRLRPLPNEVIEYKLTVCAGHRDYHEIGDNVLCSKVIRRHMTHGDVKRTRVRHGRLRGAMYTHPRHSGAALPAIIDIYGSAGGLMEHRGALFANHGFVVFCLPLFGYDNLPVNLSDEIDLEYIQEAIDYVGQRADVDSSSIGMIGSSFGGDIVLMAAAHLRGVRAHVTINAFHSRTAFVRINLDGKLLPTLQLKSDQPDAFDKRDGVVKLAPFLASYEFDKRFYYPIDNMPQDGRHVMLITGDADQNSPSTDTALKFLKAAQANGRSKQISHLRLPGSGHLIEPPNLPHILCTWHKPLGVHMSNGGNAADHNRGQNVFWQATIAYFTDRLHATPARMSAEHFTPLQIKAKM